MQTEELIFLFRGIERIIIQLGAITCVVLGIRLYGGPLVRSKTAPGSGSDLDASGLGFHVKLSNAAPGAVLALYGMAVMGIALAHPATAKITPPSTDTPQAAAPESTRPPMGPGAATAVASEGEAAPPDSGKAATKSAAMPQQQSPSETFSYGRSDPAAKALIRNLSTVDPAYATDQLRKLKASATPLLDGSTGRYHAFLLQVANTVVPDSNEEAGPVLMALKHEAATLK